jgi:hypothetical protein
VSGRFSDQQFGRLAADVDDPIPLDVEPGVVVLPMPLDALPVVEPGVVVLPLELPILLELLLPDPCIALLRCTWPLLSLQCVSGETLVEPLVPELPGEDDICAEAASAPHATNADASSNALRDFIATLLGLVWIWGDWIAPPRLNAPA